MKINCGEISYYVNVDNDLLNKDLIPIIFFHGFTGSSEDWNFINQKLDKKFLPVSIDLIGHGQTDAPADLKHYSPDFQAEHLNHIFSTLGLKKLILCGYSMGGRAALNYYFHFPENTAGMILESATAGIEEACLRNERIKSDSLIASKIETDGIEIFINTWMDQPLFSGLKSLTADNYSELFTKKLDNNPAGLINSLKGFGTGSMPSYWHKLETINIPLLFISGSLDGKFTDLNKRMNTLAKNSRHEIVRDCGHNVHLEKPEEFINLVNKYLTDNLF